MSTTIIGENIARFRKDRGLTQAELGDKIGVSNQAVSKWESFMTMPDIMLLPALAEVFGITIDALFSRELQSEPREVWVADLPWADDGIIRGVVFEGKKLLSRERLALNRSAFASDDWTDMAERRILDRIIFEIKGGVKDVSSALRIEVHGDAFGDCTAGTSMNVGGDVLGCARAGTSVSCGCDLLGGCSAGTSVGCGGDLYGNVSCGTRLDVQGDVEAERIVGSVVCASLKCDHISGEVKILAPNEESEQML